MCVCVCLSCFTSLFVCIDNLAGYVFVTDIDGCVEHLCDMVDSGATCNDVAAPGSGYTCSCSSGYSELEGMCQGSCLCVYVYICVSVVLCLCLSFWT